MDVSISNKKLRSHPHLLLGEHVQQVEKAAQIIHLKHKQVFPSLDIASGNKWASEFHDSGKGTNSFQDYIINPDEYSGDQKLKQHTLLSMIIFLTIAEGKQLSPELRLLLAAAIRGHHSRLFNIAQEELGQVLDEGHLFDWDRGDMIRLLEQQLELLDIDGLALQLNWSQEDKNLVSKLRTEGRKFLIRLKDDCYDELVAGFLYNLNEQSAVEFRLMVQYIYSILLEADKVFLALKEPEKYLDSNSKDWDPAWVEKQIGKPKQSKVNELRHTARQQMLTELTRAQEHRIFSLTAPTGVGKTLLAATWALQTRKMLTQTGYAPKIIIVLPFLSVIEQTAKEYAKILSYGGVLAEGAWMLQSHSLAPRQYGGDVDEKDEPFYLDTWHSELIITTYDQMLLSLAAPNAKYQMRFHNLCNALIVMDEVQSLPCRLWYPMEKLLMALAEHGNSRVLLMSATLPPFVHDSYTLLPNYAELFGSFSRYRMRFNLYPQSLDDFCDMLLAKRDLWLQEKKRVMITLNTRNSARQVRNCLAQEWPEEYKDIPLYFLTSDVTPRDRLEIIDKIKEGRPCIVVSTQCVEAGVDLDMEEIWRDFAPLDSLVQIAGRCNREGDRARETVTIVALVNENGKYFADMIYDKVHLQETWAIIQRYQEETSKDTVEEENILQLTELYFQALASKKDTGEQWLQDFAYWRECESIREILRGKDIEEYEFLVIKQDPGLLEEMQSADAIENRWQQREAWRKLAGRIAQITIRIRATSKFHPGWYGEPYHNYWLLYDSYYETETGILIQPQDTGHII
ncbi:MAG: CRISPR-associated helicase Cas3' [Syntrophomonadaceae bacterium]|jgi:CRISPR-associated endonuclease/helicase Cas3